MLYIVFIQLLLGLCLTIVLSLVYGTCVPSDVSLLDSSSFTLDVSLTVCVLEFNKSLGVSISEYICVK